MPARFVLVTLLIVVVAACSRPAGSDVAEASAPVPSTAPMSVEPTPLVATPEATPAITPSPSLGMALEPPPRPSDEECDRLQRSDREAALRIRDSVDMHYPEIGKGAEAVEAAIADPASDIELIGTPLRPAEVAALRTYGIWLDAAAPMGFWFWYGQPERFSGIWIDPPGSQRHVVSIADGDIETLRLARCLEREGLDVRYVWASRSWAELLALKERIVQDWPALEKEGIKIVGVGPDVIQNTVYVGVQGLTDEIAATLRERYGEYLIVAEDSPGQAD
jgi:hypothetical protein